MKTIMVTGAAGALGQTVVQYLLEHGYRVIAIARKALPDLGSVGREKLVTMNLDLADEAASAAAVGEAI
ncbi:MAG TPA: SDR family NAD(P)-dependent oxidoreductase, partial [Flavisolibacter sp.]|nr:SDR family NAD(P)-dependent oxidoreductase [Flavisolibacter sp.]